MADLVERLKRYCPRDEYGDPTRHPICDEAAAEIERLQRELSELRSVSTDKATAWDALNASHQRGRQRAFEEALSLVDDVSAPSGEFGRGYKQACDNIAAAIRQRAEDKP